jgi:hypothetical protein
MSLLLRLVFQSVVEEAMHVHIHFTDWYVGAERGGRGEKERRRSCRECVAELEGGCRMTDEDDGWRIVDELNAVMVMKLGRQAGRYAGTQR